MKVRQQLASSMEPVDLIVQRSIIIIIIVVVIVVVVVVVSEHTAKFNGFHWSVKTEVIIMNFAFSFILFDFWGLSNLLHLFPRLQEIKSIYPSIYSK